MLLLFIIIITTKGERGREGRMMFLSFVILGQRLRSSMLRRL